MALFADLMHEAPEKLLEADNVRAFLITEIMKEVQAKGQVAR